MKKIIFLLLLITSVSYGQAIAPTRVKITNNAISTTAPFIATQETDGFVNKINKFDLIEVIEYASAVNLPVTGVAGKIYVTKDNGKIYRWNGTYYAELAITDISGKVDKIVGKGLSTEDYTTLEKTKLAELFNYDPTTINNAIALKVDKVAGKSLLSDTEITRLATLSNYTHSTNHPPSVITQDASNRFVTDAEKTAWNAKQGALGFTPENVANKNTANGYAGLGSDGKLISSQLPSITISDTFVTASQAAMLALTAETGDVAVRTDLNKSYILKENNPTVLASWQELLTPTSDVASVNGRTGAVVVTKADVSLNNADNTSDINKPISTATQTALNSKENAFTKNTAFNRNFGTTAGTVAGGNDSRINNGQTAFGWGNHVNGGYTFTTGSNINQASFRTALGLGSNAYTSTDYFKYETFTADANTLPGNRSAFTYALNAPYTGTLVHFGAVGYGTQINTNSSNGDSFSFRTSNGDISAWNPWRKLWHDGNFNPANYLPLSGGDINGLLKITRDGYQLSLTGSDQGAIDLYRSGTLGHRLFSDINSFGVYDLAANVTIFSISKATGAATFSSTVTASPATLPNHAVVKSQLDAVVARPYKVYTALLSQAGTSAPVATVLENTLGGTVVWTRTGVGAYVATLSNAFTIYKTFLLLAPSASGGQTNTLTSNSSSTVELGVSSNAGNFADGFLTSRSIEIRVYN